MDDWKEVRHCARKSPEESDAAKQRYCVVNDIGQSELHVTGQQYMHVLIKSQCYDALNGWLENADNSDVLQFMCAVAENGTEKGSLIRMFFSSFINRRELRATICATPLLEEYFSYIYYQASRERYMLRSLLTVEASEMASWRQVLCLTVQFYQDVCVINVTGDDLDAVRVKLPVHDFANMLNEDLMASQKIAIHYILWLCEPTAVDYNADIVPYLVT